MTITPFDTQTTWYFWYGGTWRRMEVRGVIDETYVVWRSRLTSGRWAYELRSLDFLHRCLADGMLQQRRPPTPWSPVMAPAVSTSAVHEEEAPSACPIC